MIIVLALLPLILTGKPIFRVFGNAIMFTPTRLFYIISAAIVGSAAGGYVAWAIASRFARIAELNDRAIVEPHVLVVLCVTGGLLAFPLGAAAGLFGAVLINRVVESLRRSQGAGGEADNVSWVTQRPTTDDRPGE